MTTVRLKNVLWHSVGNGFSVNRLGNPKEIEKLCLENVDMGLLGAIRRSNLILLKADERPRFQGWNDSLSWIDWVSYYLITPRINRPHVSNARFYICTLSMSDGRLLICSEPRIVSQGSFGLRQGSEKCTAFLLSDDSVYMNQDGIFGNEKKPPPSAYAMDLY